MPNSDNFILASDSSCFVSFSSLKYQNKRHYFLVDSGASLSACTYKHVHECNIPIHKGNVTINGLGGKVQAIGYVYLPLTLGDETITQKFYVFNNLPIKASGILGRDFLNKYKAQLDFDKNVLTLFTDTKATCLALLNACKVTLNIPARSESIHFIHTNFNEDCVVLAQEIKDGVFLASSIATPKNGLIPIRILNATENDIALTEIQPKIKNLCDYDICAFEKSKNNSDRVKRLFSLMKLQHLNDEEQRTIENICAKYADIFYLPGDKLSTTDVYTHTISIKPNTSPIFSKQYRLPYSQKDEVKSQIKKMLEEGIIESSKSDWSSPILLVPKKSNLAEDKKWRLVVDYRKLNNCIEDDKFPLPDITEILESLTGSIYFTHLDLHQGYYNVKLDENSRKFTAFHSGQYQMTRMPMGLKTSPSSFSRMITMAMTGLNYEKCLIYLDDLIVFGRNLIVHNKNLQDVFNRLRTVNLKLNPAKCDFLKKEILYLGHVISGNGIMPDPAKIATVKNYPVPITTDEVKRYVAFTNYYRKFIPNFAKIAYPLNKLTRKGVPFEWNSECQQSFETLKQHLISPPLLEYPDLSKQNCFIVQTDASNNAIGAILSNGNGKPVAYASRTLNKGEKNYPVIEKELLAIVWAVKYFRPYLYGQHFKILTDHKPLIYLFNMKDPSSRLIKFRMALEEYNFEIQYIKGSDNAAADALSRITIQDLKAMHENVINVMTRAQARKLNNPDSIVDMVPNDLRPDQPQVVSTHIKPKESVELKFIDVEKLENLRKKGIISKENKILCYVESKRTIYVKFLNSKSQMARDEFVRELDNFCNILKIEEIYILKSKDNDIFIQKLLEEIKNNKVRSGPRICILNKVKSIENKDDRKVILNDFHLLPSSGHAGMRRMSNNIKRYYYWPCIEKDVREFVKRCDKCQRQKYSIPKKEPMMITSTADSAFEKIFLDLVGPLETDNDNFSYVLTLQCELSKYVEGYPLISKKSEEVARAFVNNFILRYGVPKVIATDRGKEFLSEVFQEVCKLLDIKQLNSTAYHHQSIGALEVTHKHLNAFLRIQTENHPEYWSKWIPFWCFAYNTGVHAETGFTPYELVFGKKCSLPSNLTKELDPLYNFESYPRELKYRLQLSQKEAKRNLLKSKFNRKVVYDKNVNPVSYKENDLILVKNDALCSKFNDIYSGPYVVIKDIPPNVEIINKHGKIDSIHKNRTKPYIS